MPAVIAPFLVLFAVFRQSWELLRKPQYRGLLAWVGFILLIGTAFYNNVEGWGWLDSLYFCVVTLATIGFGDFAPTTELGKAFTIIYVLLGLGLIATFASMLAKERMEMYDSRHADDVDSKADA